METRELKTRELADGCLLTVVPGAVGVSPDVFRQTWDEQPRAHTMMGIEVRRRQRTYGSAYRFAGDGGDKARTTLSIETAPALVQRCVEEAAEVAKRLGYDNFVPDMAHVNWYPGGKAGIARHQDNEHDLEAGAPIFSFTFLAKGTPARIFRVAENKTGRGMLDLKPLNGDLIVMHGDRFQDRLWHEVPKTAARSAMLGKRINVTVRQSSHA